MPCTEGTVKGKTVTEKLCPKLEAVSPGLVLRARNLKSTADLSEVHLGYPETRDTLRYHYKVQNQAIVMTTCFLKRWN